jgi:hypothetical protein
MSAGRRGDDVDDPRPSVWCLVALGYFHPIKLVTLEYAEQYQKAGWLVIGPDPEQMADRMRWRTRNPLASMEDDGA